MNIILASRSPRRKEILSRLNIPFRVIPSEIIEPKYNRSKTPNQYCEDLSKLKARTIKESFKKDLIIGADTIVVLNNKVLGKPKGKEDAYNSLNKLSGKSHRVITGVTILYKDIEYTFNDTTIVTFYDLERKEINKYINTESPYDKAGSYGIQNYSSIFV